jgi:hypothetical protein
MFSSADNYHHEEKEVLRKKPKSKKSKVKWICEISSQELIFKMVDQGVLYRPKNGYIKSVFENEIILY